MNGCSAMWVTVPFSLESMYISVQVMSQFQTQENSVCMFIHGSHEQLQQAAGPSRFRIAPSILAFISMPSAMSVKGKVEVTGSGGPASSAQADSAAAGSARADSAQSIQVSDGVFSLRYAPDVEYTAGHISTVAS